MKISTHHVDPGEAVPGVGVRLIQSHDMSEVGELVVPLLQAHLDIRNTLLNDDTIR